MALGRGPPERFTFPEAAAADPVRPMSQGEKNAVRRTIFTVKKDPTSPGNLEERIGLIKIAFLSLEPNDRAALFGSAYWVDVDQVLRKVGPPAVDRLALGLQMAIF